MFNKGQTGTSGIISLVVALIVIIAVLLVIVVDFGVTQQQIQTVGNERVVNTQQNQTVLLANQKITPGSETVLNATCTETPNTGRNCTLVDGLGYGLSDELGKIRFLNRTGDWNVSYTFSPAVRAESGTTRTILGLMPIFVAIIALVVVARRLTSNDGL